MKKKDTSWGGVATWYDKHLEDEDTYHAQVILPNLLRVIDLTEKESLLELGCGQGYFIEKFSNISANVTGVDLGKELIAIAKEKNPKARMVVGNADDPQLLPKETFDVVTIILALQNMKNLGAVVKNLARFVTPEGRVCLVLNHPTFRIPKKSSWDMDTEKKVQYRRIDGYLSESEIEIDMTPGKKTHKKMTVSYHRPLQVYTKAFAKEGFAITKIEEWISHRKSQSGPWARAEDTARKEIPLFMCLVLKKL